MLAPKRLQKTHIPLNLCLLKESPSENSEKIYYLIHDFEKRKGKDRFEKNSDYYRRILSENIWKKGCKIMQ